MPIKIARIALSAATFAIDKPYDYRVPPELSPLEVGVRVMVPFGRGNKRVEGLVLSTEEVESTPRPLKQVLARLDEEPVLDEEGMKLALWVRERWFCTLYDAAKARLPAGLSYAMHDRYLLEEGMEPEEALGSGSTEKERELLELLGKYREGLELPQLRENWSGGDPLPTLRKLMERGLVKCQTSAQRSVRDKTERWLSLALPPEEAMEQVTAKRKSAPLRYAVVELLAGVGSASVKEICYFTGASNATIKSLLKSGLVQEEEREVYRRPAEPATAGKANPITLNEEQERAFSGLRQLLEGRRAESALLYGVTGSGKTQVYLRLIQEGLRMGRGTIALVPEIALTPQLMALFTAYFGEQVAILHSSLPAGERYDEWKRIRSGKAQVVIGTRSAIFAPLKNLGLIILDEEQEGSYKSENIPRYHARDVARYRSQQENALLVLGSATPSVETMYHAQQGEHHLFTLSHRYNEKVLPQVFLADMRQELRAGNATPISQPLAREIEANLERGEQTILFLNRRGSSPQLTCTDCGHVPMCPRCSAYLTYHSANHRLMCHYCGHSEPCPTLCPECGGQLQPVGYGTQRVEEALRERYPDIEVLRMDADTVTASHSHEKILGRFREERVPILVGTQMVAKGLDFENVTLVGVIAADQGLYIDDYRAGERTFSLITQVVGRAGRGTKEGRAIIQTFTPENELILAAARQDYDSFYASEIAMRQLRACPPYGALFVLTVSGLDEGQVIRLASQLRGTLQGWLCGESYRGQWIQLLGPTPAVIAKVNDRYRYKLTLVAQNTRQIRALVAHLIRCAQKDPANRGVSVTADIDPYSG